MTVHDEVFQNDDFFDKRVRTWNERKEMATAKKCKLHKEVLPLNEKYWPWNNSVKPRGLGNLRLEEIFPDDELQKSKRMVGTLNLGKPGCGAPNVIKTREDPMLRFQWGKDLRQAVDNNIRYRKNPREQQEYKKQLDKLVREKQRLKEEEKIESLMQERASFIKTPPWGKPGPGGTLWRHPKNIGLDFMKSMGWSNRRTLNDFENDYNGFKQKQINFERITSKSQKNPSTNNKENKKYVNIKPYKLTPLLESKGNGVDLVNIIARKRYPPTVPLSTTDVTKDMKYDAHFIKWKENNYLTDLSNQINYKSEKIKKMREDDMKTVERHFATWEGFWGRPGHGAPRSAVRKGHIERLLFPQMLPVGVA